MIKLNIITRCTRLNFIKKVKESIFNTKLFDIKWWVAFDTRVIKDIDADFLTELQSLGGEAYFVKGEDGDMAHSILSTIIDKIEDGFVYFLDDDNIIHENFYQKINQSILENPNKKGFIFSQKVSGKDFTGLDVREANPNNVRVQHIDMAQFLLRRDLIGDTRFVKGDYKADGYFIEDIYKNNKEDFFFIKDILCYYNYLKTPSNFTPKVLFIGDDEPKLKSWRAADYESDELRVYYKKDDLDLQKTLGEVNPDAIVTCSKSWEDFNNLSNQNIEIRSRWIHINEVNNNTGEEAYQCAMNYILNNDKNLVSYFTPIYNIGDKLISTYNSLKNQTNQNWEWVLVNDSTDGGLTLKVAEKLAQEDNRVKIYDFREKSGGVVGESKYRAAQLCNGNIIAELDHDDYLMPTCTQTLMVAQEKYPECGFFYTDCVELDNNWQSLTYGDGFSFGYGTYREELVFDRNMQVAQSSNINPKTIRHIVGVPNHIRAWTKSAYFNAGCHNRRLSIADDYELLVRTFLTTKMLKIPKLEYLQFIHNDGGNTHNISRADIQRRVRTISDYYNIKIRDRFEELGLVDWAYMSNPKNPTWCDSRFGDEEGFVNLIFKD